MSADITHLNLPSNQHYHSARPGKRPLIAFSGGFDSTALLLQQTEGEKQVDLISIILANNAKKNECEKLAQRAIVEHLREQWTIRDQDKTYEKKLNDNICNHYFSHVGVSQQRFGFSQMPRWIIGLMDHVNPEVHSCVMIAYVAGDQATGVISELKSAWHYLWQAVFPGQPLVTLEFPLAVTTKQQLLKEMPKEIYDLTWSCEIPVKKDDDGYERCEGCPACERRALEYHMFKISQRRARMKASLTHIGDLVKEMPEPEEKEKSYSSQFAAKIARLHDIDVVDTYPKTFKVHELLPGEVACPDPDEDFQNWPQQDSPTDTRHPMDRKHGIVIPAHPRGADPSEEANDFRDDI